MDDGITLKQGIDEYKDIYLAYRNYAERTRVEYSNDIEDLVEFLKGLKVTRASQVKLTHLIRYMAELDKRGLVGSTRKRKVISIKSFFGYLFLESYTSTNVAKQLIPPYVEERKPRYLTVHEYTRLLECAKGNARDYAIIQLMLQTGIRLSELTSLTINDIHVTDVTDEKGEKVRYINVMGNKRKKGRVIPLNPKAVSTLDDYLSIRKVSNSDNLFLNRDGQKMSGRGVEKTMDKYFKLVDINNASVNSLRHTFGIQHAVKGTSFKTIQKIMGHKDNRSTRVYLQLSKDVSDRNFIVNSL